MMDRREFVGFWDSVRLAWHGAGNSMRHLLLQYKESGLDRHKARWFDAITSYVKARENRPLVLKKRWPPPLIITW